MSELTWSSAVLPAIVAIVTLLLPGAVIALATGARGVTAVLVAPPLSVAAVAVAAVVAGQVGMSWGPIPVLLTTVVLALGGVLLWWLARRFLPGTVRDTPVIGRGEWSALLAVVVGAIVIGFWLIRGFGHPTWFSQTFDNVFHQNAVQYVLDHGDVSPFHILAMTAGDGPVEFYPSIWHAVTSLAAGVSNAAPAVATNAVNLIIGAVVWPLGVTALVLTMVRLRAVHAVLAGVVVAGFSGFPYGLLDYGVLYPNYLSYALVPGVLALAASALGTCNRRIAAPAPALLLAVVGMVGIALAHPNGAVLVLAIGIAMIAAVAIRLARGWWSSRDWIRLALLGSGAVALAVIYVAVWHFIRPPESTSRWPRTQSVAQAFGEVQLQAAGGRATGYAVAVLAVLGAVWLIRRRSGSSWLVASWVIVALLFIVVSGVENQDVRDALTAVWYNNTPRLAAALPLVAAPLAVYGLTVAWDDGRRWLRSRTSVPVGAVVTVIGIIALVATVGRTALAASNRIYSTMAITEDARLIDTDELVLIEQLPALVGDDALLAVNPWFGGAMAYPIAGVEVTANHQLHGPDTDFDLIGQELSTSGPGSAVCSAVQRSGVSHVLDFGGTPVMDPKYQLPGLEDLEDSPLVELVAREGDARLWAITGCDG